MWTVRFVLITASRGPPGARLGWTTTACLGKPRRHIERRYQRKLVSLSKIEGAEFGFTDANRLLEHCSENRLKVAGRTADNLKHLRRGRLLLQCFR